jgi:hypothetical protein
MTLRSGKPFLSPPVELCRNLRGVSDGGNRRKPGSMRGGIAEKSVDGIAGESRGNREKIAKTGRDGAKMVRYRGGL